MKSTTKQQTTPERILISQDEKGVQYLTNLANTNALTLTSLFQLDPTMDNEDVILKHCGKVRAEAYVQEKFFAQFPQAREAARWSTVPFKMPNDLEQLKTALANIGPRTFEMVVFDGRWIVDVQDLEAKIDSSYRVFASSPDEIQRFQAAQAIADFLNSLNLDGFSRNGFLCDLFEVGIVNGSYALTPNKKFVFAKHLDRQKKQAA